MKRQFGNIRHLPSGRWQARYTGPDGRYINAPHTFAARLHAEAWLADRRRDLDAQLWNPDARRPQRILFAAYAQLWLTNRQARGRPLRPRTRAHYAKILERFLLPAFGDRPLGVITPAEVREWYAALPTDTPTMRAHIYRLMRAIMATAVSDELIDASPCRLRGAGTTPRVHTVRPASVDEIVALTAVMPPRLALAVPLASWCALRFGEMIELRRGDIDMRGEVIRVRRAVVKVAGQYVVGDPKSDAGIRDVAIPPHLLPAIEIHLNDHVGKSRDSLIFCAERGGHVQPSSFYRAWNKARTQVGRRDLRWHDLRHTGAVLAAATGASLAELMARLGHSSHAAALRYQHAAAGRDREIAALLSKLADGT